MQTRCGPLRMRGYIEARPHLIITLYKYPNIGAALSSRHTSRGGTRQGMVPGPGRGDVMVRVATGCRENEGNHNFPIALLCVSPGP